MIVREKNNLYVIIEQHDHGLLSGEFARRWRDKPRPLEPALYAIANHDIGWRKLDESVLWNDEADRPYSFTDYPVAPKMRAYAEGIDCVEARSPYAACLCSMHYQSFVRNSENEAEVLFREGEVRRQERLKEEMIAEELENLEYNFRLLQLCDDLSLFVCLNEPGRNTYPWYREGFRFRGERFEPVWEGGRTLRLEPNPFSAPFDLSLPYRLMDGKGRFVGSDRLGLRVTC